MDEERNDKIVIGHWIIMKRQDGTYWIESESEGMQCSEELLIKTLEKFFKEHF